MFLKNKYLIPIQQHTLKGYFLVVVILLYVTVGCKSDSGSKKQASTSDTTAPEVTAVSPKSNSSDQSITDGITITFSESLLESTVSTSTFLVTGSTSGEVTGKVKLSINGKSAKWIGTLPNDETITVSLENDITDEAGNNLESYSYSFAT